VTVGGVSIHLASAPLVQRRRAYSASIFRGDYFILKHLTRFLHDRLPREVRAGDVVVDVGCGEQPLRGLVQALGARYVGTDVTQNAQGTVDHVCSITRLALEDASADVVICTEVLEHVSETACAFDELARVLAPGGRIVVTVPFAYPLHEEPYDFVRLTPYQIRACATACGLEVAEVQTAGNELEVIATVVDNLWNRMHSGDSLFWRAVGLASRVVLNPFTLALSTLVGRQLPARYYLSTLAVLRKPG
jgi:SAM-dependent methyltransferase